MSFVRTFKVKDKFPRPAESYVARIRDGIRSMPISEIEELVRILLSARKKGATVFLAGNGGSTSTTAHYAVDWMLGTGLENPSLRVISLGESASSITATGNDQNFESVFSRQLKHLGKSDDVLVVLSASGNSPNLISVCDVAHEQGLIVVAVTGFNGGQLGEIADLSVHCPTQIGDYGVAEDLHSMIGHIVKEELIWANS